jgi:hypothetical protein
MELQLLFKKEIAAAPFFTRIKDLMPSYSYPASGVSSVPILNQNMAGWKADSIQQSCRFKNGSVLRTRKKLYRIKKKP